MSPVLEDMEILGILFNLHGFLGFVKEEEALIDHYFFQFLTEAEIH